MQTDGNLVTYQGTTAIWNSGTANHNNCVTYLQTDGNLVIASGSTSIWNTSTNGTGVARLSLDNDRKFRLTTCSNTTAWTS